jgi:hypothetical protein
VSLPLPADPRHAAERVGELRERIQGMQRDRWEAPGTPMSGGLARLLPHGSLRRGSAYTVDNSTSLIMAILGAATRDGSWSAVVGLADFGAEAAIGFGLDLERLVLVPDPGEHWLAVTAALVDVLPLVVVRPERTVGDADVTRLGARLRQTGCTLLVAGAWPQSEAALRVTDTRWDGLGDGHGALSGRDLTVDVRGRAGSTRVRSERLRLPDSAPAADPTGQSRPARPRLVRHS